MFNYLICPSESGTIKCYVRMLSSATGLCHPEADHFRGVMKMGVISQQLYFLPR